MYNKLTVEDVDVKGKKMVVLGAGGAATRQKGFSTL